MEVIHKGAKLQRPPKGNRRGSALAPVSDLKQALRPSDTLEQTHMDEGTLSTTRFYVVDENAFTVRELAIVGWKDDGGKVMLTMVKNFSKEVPKDLKHKVRSLSRGAQGALRRWRQEACCRSAVCGGRCGSQRMPLGSAPEVQDGRAQ